VYFLGKKEKQCIKYFAIDDNFFKDLLRKFQNSEVSSKLPNLMKKSNQTVTANFTRVEAAVRKNERNK
jgi:hypothetical protein